MAYLGRSAFSDSKLNQSLQTKLLHKLAKNIKQPIHGVVFDNQEVQPNTQHVSGSFSAGPHSLFSLFGQHVTTNDTNVLGVMFSNDNVNFYDVILDTETTSGTNYPLHAHLRVDSLYFKVTYFNRGSNSAFVTLNYASKG
jgi:hypothetical protein